MVGDDDDGDNNGNERGVLAQKKAHTHNGHFFGVNVQMNVVNEWKCTGVGCIQHTNTHVHSLAR